MDVHVNRGLLLVVFVVLFLSRRGDCSTIVEACQSLVQASLENPHCSPLGNCSGLVCVASDGGRAEFTVRKCQDPVAVDLEYRPPSNNTNGSSSSVAFMRSFTYSQTVEGDPVLPGGTLEVDMARNDTYLSFGALPLIPHVLIPLNSSECLCASMSQLAQSPVAPVSCDISDQLDYCDGVVCSLEVFGQGYKMELEVFSCTDPPSVHLTFRDLQDAVVYQHTFSDSEEVPVNLGVTVTLRFTLIHSNYSMTIRVDIVDVPLLGTINVLPEQTIILDLENCDSSLTGPPPTAPTGLPTGVPTPEACASLQQLASTATCQASSDCSYVDCVILDPSGGGIYFLTVEPLPCETPPSLFFSLRDAFGNELYSRSLYENTTIDLGPLVNVNLTLLVVVTHPSSDALGIQVNLVLPEPVGTSTPVVPYSEIPLDESSCQNATGSPTHVSSATPPVDTTTPTCSALEGMAGEAPDSFSCSTNTEATRGTCDTVTCDTELLGTNYRAIAKVLPCHTPPAVMMVFLDVGSGRVLLNHTFTRSEEESILGGLVTVSVTLDQLENAIGLQIEATIPAQGTVTILPYSTIPIDTSNCNRGTQTTTASISPVKASTSLYATPPITVSTTPTTSMKGSTSLYAMPPITVSTTPTSSVPISIPSVTPTEALPGKNRQVVVIAVSVVSAIVVVALGTAAVLGVALVYYRHRKQRRFQPISLRTLVNDEDDDDEDE